MSHGKESFFISRFVDAAADSRADFHKAANGEIFPAVHEIRNTYPRSGPYIACFRSTSGKADIL